MRKPGKSEDELTEVLRSGTQKLLAQAIEAEVESFLSVYSSLSLADGRRRVVRNGYQPEREVRTGIGSVTVRMPRSRDKVRSAGKARIRFSSKILPPYLRRTKSREELIP